MFRRLLCEAIGTFLLLFSVGVSNGEPFAVGGTLLCTMCVTGFVSGCHFNPAVTCGIIFYRYLNNNLTMHDFTEMILYIIVQFIAGIFGGLVGWGVLSYPVHFDVTDGFMDAETFYAEMIYTCFIVGNALVVGRLSNNPIICGGVVCMAVTAADWTVGKISGGCFNPAIGFGINIINYARNGSHLDHTWIYILAPVLGGLVAAPIAKIFTDVLDEQKQKNS